MGKYDRIVEDGEVSMGNFFMERMSDSHIFFIAEGIPYDLYAVKGKLIWKPQASAGWMGVKKDFEAWKEGYDERV